MKYEVGQKVRVVRDHKAPKEYVGQVGVIEEDHGHQYVVRFKDGDFWYHNDSTVVAVEDSPVEKAAS